MGLLCRPGTQGDHKCKDTAAPRGIIQLTKLSSCTTEAVVKMGGQIFEVSHVDKFPGDKVEVAGGGTARGDHVVYATHTPIHHDLTVHARQQPFRFYAITLNIPKVGTKHW